METTTLDAKRRSEIGTRSCRQMRQRGEIPGIIYGPKDQPLPFTVNQHDLEVELLHKQRVLKLNLDGSEQSFLIKKVQYDHMGISPLHLDLIPVNLSDTVQVEVQIELRGTPAGTSEGGVLEQLLNSVLIECRASDIPDTLRVPVVGLQLNESLTVADLDLQPGIKALAEPTDLVAALRLVADEEEPEEVVDEDANEPEVISRGKGESEQGGDNA